MKKTIKNFILFLVIVLSLGFVTPTFAVDGVGQTAQTAQPIQTEQNVADTSSKTSLDLATKTPLGRKQLALKFIIAMMGVVVSSVVIYVGLSIYNKLVYGVTTRTKDNDYTDEDYNYKTPSNMKEALNIFLKKTK